MAMQYLQLTPKSNALLNHIDSSIQAIQRDKRRRYARELRMLRKQHQREQRERRQPDSIPHHLDAELLD